MLPKYYPELTHFLDSVDQLDKHKYKVQAPPSAMYRVGQENEYNRVELYLTTDGLSINGSEVSREDAANFLDSFIKKYSPSHLIILDYDSAISFGDYVKGLDIIHYAYDHLRIQKAIELFGNSEGWDDNYNPKYDQLRQYYPRYMLEWTPEEKRLIKLLEQQQKKID